MPVKLILVIPVLAFALTACQRENPSSAATARPTAAAPDTARKWAVPPAIRVKITPSPGRFLSRGIDSW